MSASESHRPPSQTDGSAEHRIHSDEDPSPPAGALTRGFLFADLRGYTSFVESRGAVAGAELLYRYRALVRDAVGRHQGAEIKTEGDSFYVVFSSVSQAVACGLAIVDGAAAASDEHPEDPIRVGVGVHAGETVETPEGYVGTAVNMAARLCSAAGEGEVLVSDTVRMLTANTSDVRYEAVGRRRLKGIAEAVAVHRALPAGANPSPRRRARPTVRPMVAVAGIAAVGVVVLAGLLLRDTLFGVAAASPTPTPTMTPSEPASVEPEPSIPVTPPEPSEGPVVGAIPLGPLNPGTYVSRILEPGVTFAVDTGWVLVEEIMQGVHLTWAAGPGRDLWVVPFRGAIASDDPIARERVEGIDTAETLVTWIAAHEHLDAEEPVFIDLTNSRGQSVDFIAAIPDDRTECGYVCIALFWVTEDINSFDRFAIGDGGAYRIVALDLYTEHPDAPVMLAVIEVQDPAEFDEFAAEAHKVITTLVFASDQ